MRTSPPEPAPARAFDPSWAKGLTAATDGRVRRMAQSKTGKANWAKGLTAATDTRIAKQTATRLGKRRGPYRPRRPYRPDGAAAARFDPTSYLAGRRADYAYL